MDPPGTLKRTTNDKIPKGHVPNFWGRAFAKKKPLRGDTSAIRGLSNTLESQQIITK